MAKKTKKTLQLEDIFEPEVLEFVKKLPKWKQRFALRIAPIKKGAWYHKKPRE